MHANAETGMVSRTMVWTGRVMSGLVALLIGFASVVKLINMAGMAEGMARAGFPMKLLMPIGLIELMCVIVYVIPRTAVLGAILITGLMGGATVTSLRIGDPTYLVTVLLGMMAWGGLYLRDRRLRDLIPLVRS